MAVPAVRPGRRPEHLAIIEAVCSRNPDQAERAMQVHLDSVLKVLATFVTPPMAGDLVSKTEA